jgi:hypothetical protein
MCVDLEDLIATHLSPLVVVEEGRPPRIALPGQTVDHEMKVLLLPVVGSLSDRYAVLIGHSVSWSDVATNRSFYAAGRNELVALLS